MLTGNCCGFSAQVWSRYLAEFLGTMFLVMTYRTGNTVSILGSVMFEVAFILTTLMYTFFYQSGAHFNPCVTIGVLVAGGTDDFQVSEKKNIGMYILMQFLGALLGGAFGCWMVDYDHNNTFNMECALYPYADGDTYPTGNVVVIELVFTFLLVSCYLHCCVGQPDNSFYGIAMGALLFCVTMTAGQINASPLNMAVYLGLVMSALMFSGAESDDDIDENADQWWAYWLGEVCGAVLAGVIFRFVFVQYNGAGQQDEDQQRGQQYQSRSQKTGERKGKKKGGPPHPPPLQSA